MGSVLNALKGPRQPHEDRTEALEQQGDGKAGLVSEFVKVVGFGRAFSSEYRSWTVWTGCGEAV